MYKSIFILVFIIEIISISPVRNQNLSSNNTDNILNYNKLPSFYKAEFDSIYVTLNNEQKLNFSRIYRMMPLEDALDYSPKFHFENLKTTLEAKENMSWGNKISESDFIYFVLPLRVNNENLDTSRIFFYKELRARIRNMEMLDAAMEINHWCHEHVTYRASNNRTSSPMTSYRNAYGRCGEESVFVVSALRSVGIPARQVYTPRWAHTDDNHAWVEFWADGKWHYYGATEPEASVDHGWFTEPARRAMLVGTRIDGKYDGIERINYQTSNFAVINTLKTYTTVKEVFVKVIDEKGEAVKGAKVDFQIYNYAEYYTISPKTTNDLGLCSFLTGFGDLLVWVSKNQKFNYAELDVRATDTMEIKLNKSQAEEYKFQLDYNPPVEKTPIEISDDGFKKNNLRLKYEDSLRSNYEKSFIDSSSCQELALKNSLPFNDLYKIMQNSRGNWREISDFINNASKEKKTEALLLLQVISEKDLHDINSNILLDHLNNVVPFNSMNKNINYEMWSKYVLNPRVEFEMLLPYRRFLSYKLQEKKLSNPKIISTWILDSILLDSTNFSHVPISAQASFESKLTDGISRDLIFVQACRSIGVPARLEAATLLPQYFDNNQWVTVNFMKAKIENVLEKAILHLSYASNSNLKYYKNFTISAFQNGAFNTLEFDWDKDIKDFPKEIKLDPGYYRLCTGTRLSDGSVLSELTLFNLELGKVKDINVEPRKASVQAKKLGQLKMESEVLSANKKSCTIVSTKSVVAIWINPNTEPAKHIIQDISNLKTEFENLGNKILLITKDEIDPKSLDKEYFSTIPKNAEFFIDYDFRILSTLNTNFKTSLKNHLPIVMIINDKGEINFMKMGYTIGIGEDLLNYIKH
ncbi:MAG: hypothetical protein AUJ98_08855 [Bacteroidetes bacterium CG2_30_33_31]|nr:MAG: hypothetical protein AUJ98_08855 [Bacteroidetes bacterium CG2_30_33_31]